MGRETDVHPDSPRPMSDLLIASIYVVENGKRSGTSTTPAPCTCLEPHTAQESTSSAWADLDVEPPLLLPSQKPLTQPERWRVGWAGLIHLCQIQPQAFPLNVTPSQALAPICSARERSTCARDLLTHAMSMPRVTAMTLPAFRLRDGLENRSMAPIESFLPLEEFLSLSDRFRTTELASIAPWQTMVHRVDVSSSAMSSATGFCATTLESHQVAVLARQMRVEDQVQLLPPVGKQHRSMASSTALADDPVVLALVGQRHGRGAFLPRQYEGKRRQTIAEFLGLASSKLLFRRESWVVGEMERGRG